MTPRAAPVPRPSPLTPAAALQALRIAVVVTTYNRPDALRAVLDGYAAQSDTGFELLVADDGSGAETRAVIEACPRELRDRLRHVWQEDRGFRAAAIRNRAVAGTRADYVVFTDGDCVPPRDFVAAHRDLARPGRFVAGNRVLLSEAFTRRVLAERLPIHAWPPWRWAAARVRGHVNRLLPLLRRPAAAPFRDAEPERWAGVKTCNLAVWRDDLVRVNGLDESYEGWGLEDSDLVIRLIHAGVLHRNGRFLAPVFHLWHAENDRSRLERNRARLDDLLRSDAIRAERGLDDHAGSTHDAAAGEAASRPV